MAVPFRYPVHIDIDDDFHCSAGRALLVELRRVAEQHGARIGVSHDSPLADRP